MPQSKANVSVDMPVPPREETREGHMGSTAQPPNPAPASPASGSVPEVGGASPSPAMQPDTASPNNKKDTSQDFLTLAGNRAATVVNKVDSILKSLSEIAELLEALRLDFKRLRSDKTIPAGSTIMECSSFPEFCEKVLGRKKQTVYEALEKWRDEQEALPIGHTTFKKAESAGKTKTKTPQTQPTSKNISPPSDPPGSSSSVKKTVIHADPGPQLEPTRKLKAKTAQELLKLMENQYIEEMDAVFHSEKVGDIQKSIQVFAQMLCSIYIGPGKATVKVDMNRPQPTITNTKPAITVVIKGETDRKDECA